MAESRANYHHGDLRAALVEGARSLIDEEGVSGLSLRAVARRAGVSAAAPYHHFKSRSALLAAVATDGFKLLHEYMSKAVADRPDDPGSQLSAMGESYAQFALEHPAYFRVMFRPELANKSEFPELEQASDPVFEELTAMVIAAQEDHQIPSGDHRHHVLLAWAAVHGISSLLVDGPLQAGFDKLGFDVEEYGRLVSSTLCSIFRNAAAAQGDD